jgi:RNA polymerase sigma-70 factor (ECF subfamily)
MDPQERHWVFQARRNDAAAWEALVRRYQEPVFRLAYLVLRDAAEAEDVAQETFLRAYLALESYDPERPLRPWLMRIALNRARNRSRSIGRYLANLRRSVERGAGEPGAHPQRQEPDLAAWQAANLWAAVQRLDRSGQDVIYCRYFLGLSEAETAEALTIPPGTVKSRLHRGLRKLRQVIEADYPGLRDLFNE